MTAHDREISSAGSVGAAEARETMPARVACVCACRAARRSIFFGAALTAAL